VPRSSTTFQPGNLAALKTGTRSRTVVETRANQVRAELTALLAEHLPEVTPADQPMVDLAVDVATKLRLISDFLGRTSGGSLIDGRGRPRSAATLYVTLLRECRACFSQLGIGPVARGQVMAALGLQNDRRSRAAKDASVSLMERYSSREAAS